MIKKLIQKHIKKLTIKDIYEFAYKNGICLKESEANIIFEYIQKDWEQLIFHDHTPILKEVENSLEKETIKKIEELIILFKNKYKCYL